MTEGNVSSMNGKGTIVEPFFLDVLSEESEDQHKRWTAMECYMREHAEKHVLLGVYSSQGTSTMKKEEKSEKAANNVDAGESTGDDSSPSWASSSTGNTPSYNSGGLSFDFNQKCTITKEDLSNDHEKENNIEESDKNQRANASRLRLCGSLSSDQLAVLDSEPESPTESAIMALKKRKGSTDFGHTRMEQIGTLSSIKSGKLTRLLRRTHSAGCSKDVPAHALFLRERTPVTKTKSAESTPTCARDEAEDKARKTKKTLAKDMKLRLSFLRRRHTDSSLQPPSVRPTPEEAQKWTESFNELMANKYGVALFKAFLSREFSEENIEFWLACEDFKKSRPNKLPSKARKIYNDFVAVQSPKEVNVDSNTRTSIMNKLLNPDRECFDLAQRRIQGMLEQDAYLRFLQSDMYLELLQTTNNTPR